MKRSKTMIDKYIKKYQILNELAEPNGTVIFGGSDDKDIPLCELKQAFVLNSVLYNRSIDNLSVNNALEVYKACTAELYPETVLLHIGAADIQLFTEKPSEFEKKYCELISYIRSADKKCRIAIVSLKNPDESGDIAKLNKQLKYIAESEQCEYCDISSKRVWNPKQAMNVASFVYDLGFVRPLKNKRPLFELVKILFCYDA